MPEPFQFTSKAEQTIASAQQLAANQGNSTITPIHLALALIQELPEGQGQNVFQSIIFKAGGDPKPLERALNKLLVRLPTVEPPVKADDLSLSGQSGKVVVEAQNIMKTKGDSFISQDVLVVALLVDPTIATAFKEAGLNEASVKNAANALRAGKHVDNKSAEAGFEALAKYAINLTELARQGKLDPVIGRDDAIRRIIRILSRRTKNNPVLIGEPGVGKTAAVEGLAQRIVARDVPASLIADVWSLDVGALISGASHRGEYEERVKAVVNEVEKSGNIILFIDEMHLLMNATGGIDASQMLKPALARGQLRCIGATTLGEFKKYVEKDAAFERRFQQVLINEPSVPETISILRGLREKYEVHHGVDILDSALVQAAVLAHRYLTARKLPDSAIDLVDEAASGIRVSRDTKPEAIDNLERTKLQAEVEKRALEHEKGSDNKDRIKEVEKKIAEIDESLRPLQDAYKMQKERADAIQKTRQRIDELQAKADAAERSYDLAAAADIRYFSIPHKMEELQKLEKEKREEDARRGDLFGLDIVTPEAIAEVVAKWSGIPVQRLKETEKEKLLSMDKLLASEVVGQPDAVRSISNAIRLSRSGLNDSKKPIASFLFCGPSGTGKTQMSKALARFLFDSEDALMRIDASEYSEKHSISRLIGSPPGYVGYDDNNGTLAEFIRRKPYSVVLIDEIEKASKEFTTIFLQVLDDGRLTDGQGRTVSFRNTVIIMTSNLGAQFLNDAPEENGKISKATRELVMGSIRAHFLPEFVGRIDSIILFNKLGGTEVRKIVDIRLKEVQQRLTDNGKNITLQVSDEAKDWLGHAGISPTYGARPLARVIQNELLVPLSRFLIAEAIGDGEVARVTADFERNRLVVHPNHEVTVGQAWHDGMEVDGDDGIEIEEVDD